MAPLRFGSLAWVVAIGALTACGSRSNLESPSPDGGAGGAGGGGGTGGSTVTTTTATTTTTSDGGGGTGGAPMGPCAELSFLSPYVSLQGGAQSHQRSPKLAYSSQQKTRVTMASAWQATEGPGDLPIELRHTSFDPWIDFPAGSSLGPTYLADLDAGVSFAIAQGPGDLFAMLFRDFQMAPPGGLRFAADFKPKSGDVPVSFLVDPLAQHASFLSYNGKVWLYGAGRSFQNDDHELRIGVVNEDFVESQVPVACSSPGALPADATPIEDGFLVGIGTSQKDLADCASAGPAPPGGPLVVLVKGTDAKVLLSLETPGPIADLRMAPRDSGAWLAWYDPGNDALVPSLVVAAVSEFGGLLVLPSPSPTACLPGSLATASFQDFLMVSCIVPEPEGASAFVQVFDPDGVPRGAATVPSTSMALGSTALLGSPVTRSAVLAWSELGSIGDQLRVTRVDCVDGK